MAKKIQVHYIEEDGTKGVVNYLNSDNTEAQNEAMRSKLREKAIKFCSDWSKVFPTTKFFVKEVSK